MNVTVRYAHDTGLTIRKVSRSRTYDIQTNRRYAYIHKYMYTWICYIYIFYPHTFIVTILYYEIKIRVFKGLRRKSLKSSISYNEEER